MIPAELLEAILAILDLTLDTAEVDVSRVSGGDINDAYRLSAKGTSYFVKVNISELYPDMFLAEAKGLELMRSKSDFHIPEVLGQGEVKGHQFLVMEFLEQGSQSEDFWELFAARLTGMHRSTNKIFGLDHSNFIGSLVQINTPCTSWAEFFARHRLAPLAEKAFDEGRLSKSAIDRLEGLYPRLENLLPHEPPSLLHGDLWSGNFMCGADGHATIYDPAVYYGHREMDLAMSKLFGGFDKRFYSAYCEEFPLESGWEERIALHNLYPLLVHVVLFGGGYSGQVQSILHRFSA